MVRKLLLVSAASCFMFGPVGLVNAQTNDWITDPKNCEDKRTRWPSSPPCFNILDK